MKWIFRRDNVQGFVRVARICWEHGIVGQMRNGYSAKLSFAFAPRLFRRVEHDAITDWRLTILGVRVHYCQSYGGLFP